MPEDGRFIRDAETRLQRARGRAGVVLALSEGQVRLTDLHQSGCAKAFLPRVHSPVPEAVFLNTAGGLTGGDHVEFTLKLGGGARAVATTQTAERAYASAGGCARMEVSLQVGQNASLDWLPQETILFERSSLARRTVVDLAAGSAFLMAEMVVLGRGAMGEILREIVFSDWRDIRREGRPVIVEPLRIAAPTLAAGAAALGGARAIATIIHVADRAEAALAPVRAALPDGVEAAASAWQGRLVVRLLGPDLFPVKRAVADILRVLRGQPLPRVWQI